MAVETRTTLPDELCEFILEWKHRPGNLIMILHRVQQHYKYLPEPVVDEVARLADLSLAQIYGVATFYNFFNLTPPGKHRIAVCMGTACYLKGAPALTEELSTTLKVGVNEVTEDKQFSLLEVRCVGCCGLAPAVLVDEDLYGKLTPEKVQEMLDNYQEGA
ncbi:MAG: NAD(P)H-dependent oxidoreductase subunit E [Spirochaetaceae bacterium]|nr:MAG: NAD(P)H-dependent oxidoreductase subunit E [Spirochaetaceae bacterium]